MLPLNLGSANFLDSVADGRSDVGDWQPYMATHYADPVVEAARREAVRIVAAIPVGAVLAAAAREQLRRLAHRLRELAT